MTRRILIFLSVLIMLLASFTLVSCGDDDEQYQIGYSGGNVGYAFHYTRRKVGNKISFAGNNFTSEGHHLVGFFTEDGLQYFDENGVQLPDILIEGDIYVIAREEPDEYTFNFKLEENTFEDGSKEKSTVIKFGENDYSGIPTVTHQDEKYVLDGWFDGETRYTDGTTFVYDKLSSLEHNTQINLSAKYKIKEYTITLNYNDGVTESKDIKVKHGEKLGDLSEYCVDDGEKEITGWSYISYGEMPVTEAITEDMTVYAIWTKYKDITFSCGEYGEVVKRIYTKEGQSIALPVYVIPGYKATAWYNNSIFSGNPVERVPYGALVDTYYGKFEPTDYQITFVTGSEDIPDSITYSYKDTVTLPVLYRENYLFLGWKLENDDTLYSEVSSDMWGDFTFTAVWLQSTAISTVENFDKVRANPKGSFHLINDIDLQGATWIPIDEFKGIFNGQGYRIHSFKLPESIDNATGFFAKNRGEINEVIFENIAISYTSVNAEKINVGIICGINTGKITNCSVKAGNATVICEADTYIDSLIIGGMCGYNQGEIYDSHIDVNIILTIKSYYNGSINVGGLVGENDGKIILCEVTSAIKDEIAKRERSTVRLYMGGAIGKNNGTVEKAYSNSTVESKGNKTDGWDNLYIGGLIASNNGDVKESCSKGRVEAAYGKLSGAGIGGLIGTGSGEITNCYTLSSVISSFGQYCSTGGLVGSFGGTLLNCYANNKELRGNGGYVGGFAGSTSQGSLIKGSYSNYSSAIGSQSGEYTTSTFYATGISESVAVDVLNWDKEAWSFYDKFPELSWRVKWIDIEIPQPPEMLEPTPDEPEAP